jgi:hypothetical protein
MKANSPAIILVDERHIIEVIKAARRRVLYMAPGLTKSIAAAIEDAFSRLRAQDVSVILDVDPEVCRLGYGTIEGLTYMQRVAAKSETLICHQKGVRIGLLISDDTTLIYSPRPLLVEGRKTDGQPNAIQLTSLPTEVAHDVGLGTDPDSERKIGLDPVQPQRIEEVRADLLSNPPLKFALARKVRVFNSRFQFVELEMTGCFISKKKVPIPSNLMGLAKDAQTQQRLHASFDLVGKTQLSVKVSDKTLSEESLRRKKAEIVKRFLTNLTGYGSVILRSNKDNLQSAVKDLQDDITAFQTAVKTELQKHIDTNRDAVVVALLPGVRENPPDHYTKIHGPKPPEAVLKKMLADEIADAFGAAEDVIQEMKATLIFKDVAYESLVDPKFVEIARKAMPGVDFLHEEYDAAKESDDEEDADTVPVPKK